MLRSKMISVPLFFVLCLCCPLCGAFAQDLLANTYGGTGYDYAYSIQQTADGGYVFCGPGTLGAGLWDFWIVKLDASGNISWQKTYGGSKDDIPNCVRQTADGGYIVAGRTASFGAGGNDAWILRLDSSGGRVWQKTFGGSSSSSYDAAYSVVENQAGEFFVACWTDSYGAGYSDYWIIKLASDGSSIWQKTLGGSASDAPYSCCLSADGGIVVAGGGSVVAGQGYDVWVVKLNASGSVVWQKAYGGTLDDLAFSIKLTSDGGYIVAGFTYSFGDTSGERDVWVLRLDPSGNIVWQKTYGGTSVDWAFGAQQTADGGYIVVGRTDSFGTGTDAWILKLDPSGNVAWQRNYGGGLFEYAYCVCQAADGSFVVGGITNSFGTGSYDAMILKLEASCVSGASCAYLGATSVTPRTPSPTTTATDKTPTSTSVTAGTTIPTSSNSAAQKKVQCIYPARTYSGSIALTVSVSGDDPLLNWQAPGGTCAVTGYGVYRGTLPISSYDHESLNCSVSDVFYLDTLAGDNQYYLVVPHNTGYEGSYGTAFDGVSYTERPAGVSQCRPACLLPCL